MSLLLLVPYFAYVFAFLDPAKVIARIGAQTLESAAPHKHKAEAGTTTGAEQRQEKVVSGLEQLAGIAMNALAQKEKTIASDATAALRTVLVDYLPEKAGLPAAWFGLSRTLRVHPDFVALAPESLDELARERTWLEWIGLRQIREVFAEALKTLPEMTHVVAIDTRYVGEAALDSRDRDVLALIVKFMKHVSALVAQRARRTHLLQRAPPVPPARRGDAARARHGRPLALAAARGRRHALQVLRAARPQHGPRLRHGDGGLRSVRPVRDRERPVRSCHDRLLSIFLEIDKEAETVAEEKALRGVRKAQAKLASFYLLRNQTAHARAIYDDMAQESPERLRSIRDEMLAVTRSSSGRSSTAARTSTTSTTRAKRSCAPSSASSRRS